MIAKMPLYLPIKLAVKDLGQRKVRTFLTILGLTISVIAAIGFDLIGSSVFLSSSLSYEESFASDIVISHQEQYISGKLFENFTEIKKSGRALRTFFPIAFGEQNYTAIAFGFENFNEIESGDHISGTSLLEGRIANSNEVLLDHSDANELNINLDDKVTVKSQQTSNESLPNINYNISGFSRNPGAMSYNFRIGVSLTFPLETLQEVTNKSEITNLLYFNLDASIDVSQFSSVITNLLLVRGITVYQVTLKETEKDWRSSFLSLFSNFAYIISIIGLLIGGIFVATTLSMNIEQNRREIAIMKTMGGTPGFVFKIYLIEILILGFCGALIGLPASIGITYLLLDIYSPALNLTVTIVNVTAFIIGKGIFASIIDALIFGIIPVYRAVNSRVIKSIKPDSKIENRKYKTRVRFVPLFYALRNIRRQRLKSLVILVTITISLGVGVGTTSSLDSAHSYVDNWIESLDFDLTISIPFAVNSSTIDDFFDEAFGQIPGVLNWFDSALWLTGTLNSTEINATDISLCGVTPGKQAYQFLEIESGRGFMSSDENESSIMISSLLSEITGLQPGDEVFLNSPAVSQKFKIIGIHRDLFLAGYAIYLPISQLQAMFNFVSKMVNVYLIRLHDSSTAKSVKTMLQNLNAPASLNIQDKEFWKKVATKQVDFFRLFSLAIQAILTLITMIGSTNIILMIAFERRKEFAILKIIGGTPVRVFMVLITEGFILGAIASLLSLPIIRAIGPFLLQIASHDYIPGIPYIYNLDVVLSAIIVGCSIGVFSCILPSIQVLRSSVMQGLRYD